VILSVFTSGLSRLADLAGLSLQSPKLRASTKGKTRHSTRRCQHNIWSTAADLETKVASERTFSVLQVFSSIFHEFSSGGWPKIAFGKLYQ
jgi:hypothetical protein